MGERIGNNLKSSEYHMYKVESDGPQERGEWVDASPTPFLKVIMRIVLNKRTHSEDWALDAFLKLEFVEPKSHLVFWLGIHF